MKKNFLFLIPIVLLSVQSCTPPGEPVALEWPEITQENKPWTRWWWMGNSVDDANLTRSLELYEEAGLGGVEITPIYGVRGQEDQFVDYLSSDWVDRLIFTLDEASRLGLGVDMATGTGWPFGGPHVEADDASRYVAHKTYTLQEGQRLNETISYIQQPILRTVNSRPELSQLVEPIRNNENLQALAIDQVRFSKPIPLQVLMAYSDEDEVLDLTDQVDENGQLDWTAVEGNWTLYAVFQGWHGKMVERAAPGGEGYALNHFSEAALDTYLSAFDEAFSGRDISSMRGFFNDSYEVDDASGEADWTPAFFEAFEQRRGYDLRMHLPALFGNDEEDMNRRVLVDYRRTLSDLLLDEFTKPWTTWAHEKGAVTRNQAHGSPASILDLYAATDIPETESTEMMRIKFASSASNVTGKALTSAEAATWLDEHFLSDWADVKEAVDRFFLGGVNHIVYHGTSYSPEDAAWPGWLFYAAVHFSPQNPMWGDFNTLNDYVARVQSILQSGRPANDVLLYLPLLDRYAQRDPSMLVHFHGLEPFEGMTVEADAEFLHEQGYAFDFVSDLQIQATESDGTVIMAGGNEYRTVVVPAVDQMPIATLERLLSLAEAGVSVVFHEQLPRDVPGLGDLENRQEQLSQLLERFAFENVSNDEVQSVSIGSGQFLLGSDLGALLMEAEIQPESFVDSGLEYVRRSRTDGMDYVLVHWGDAAIDGWVLLNQNARSVGLFNPMTGNLGVAKTRPGENGGTEVYLQLLPGETLIVRTYEQPVEAAEYMYLATLESASELQGPWEVQFTEGGPALPERATIDQLESWTEFAGDAGASFSGTATYSITVTKPEGDATAYVLDLGEVHETARVYLNGAYLETLIGPNYQLVIDATLLQASNQLDVEVSNLMANRIASMEREGANWKMFYNINFPARLAENRNAQNLFVADQWLPMPSGLMGPVTLTPVEPLDP